MLNNIDVLAAFNLVVTLTQVMMVLAGIIGVLRFRHLTPAMRYLAVTVWFGILIELVSDTLHFWHIPNLFLGPLDSAGGFLLFSLVYRRALQSAAFSRVQPWLAGAFVLYAGVSSLLLPETTRFKPLLQVVECLLVLLLVVLYFRKLLNELMVQQLTRDAMFWASTGLLLYYLGKLQISLFSNYLMQYSKQFNLAVWTVHALLLAVMHGCFCVALWMRPQK